MRAEHQMNARTVRELPQYGSDPLNQRLNIQRMVVKIVDRAFRRAPRIVRTLLDRPSGAIP